MPTQTKQPDQFDAQGRLKPGQNYQQEGFYYEGLAQNPVNSA